jgi:hypothetical protein
LAIEYVDSFREAGISPSKEALYTNPGGRSMTQKVIITSELVNAEHIDAKGT